MDSGARNSRTSAVPEAALDVGELGIPESIDVVGAFITSEVGIDSVEFDPPDAARLAWSVDAVDEQPANIVNVAMANTAVNRRKPSRRQKRAESASSIGSTLVCVVTAPPSVVANPTPRVHIRDKPFQSVAMRNKSVLNRGSLAHALQAELRGGLRVTRSQYVCPERWSDERESEMAWLQMHQTVAPCAAKQSGIRSATHAAIHSQTKAKVPAAMAMTMATTKVAMTTKAGTALVQMSRAKTVQASSDQGSRLCDRD